MTITDTILWPLTLPYGAAVRLRAAAYRWGVLRRQRIGGAVIGVGNLTTGGTGKTPMVLWIAQRLVAEGKSAGILTRGYRGEPGAKRSLGEAGAELASDEAQLLKSRLGERVPLGIGADRFARGRELAKRGIRWFVLDDGFQHQQLARDVDIVLLDASNPFGGGRLLPSGRLREPRSALARADIIVITRSAHSPGLEAAIRQDSAAPIFYAEPRLDSICAMNESASEEDADPRERKLFAFCGIGNPPAFMSDLRKWGFQIAGHKFFRDHHRYTQQDIFRVEEEARGLGAEALICTEKDAFNLPGVRGNFLNVFYCRISMHVDREDEFWREIMSRADPAAPGSSR